MPHPNPFHQLKKILLEQLNLEIHDHVAGKTADYGACHFKLYKKNIEFRSSKITPKKIGQFVAIWRRNEQGLTQPFEETDPLDFMIIRTRSGYNFGFFIFPKGILIERAIITSNGKMGKKGIRVYPPWEKTISRQAQKTQSWQGRYFVSMSGVGGTMSEI